METFFLIYLLVGASMGVAAIVQEHRQGGGSFVCGRGHLFGRTIRPNTFWDDLVIFLFSSVFGGVVLAVHVFFTPIFWVWWWREKRLPWLRKRSRRYMFGQ